MNQEEIEELKKNVFSEDSPLVKSSIERLAEVGGPQITDFLMSLLSLDNFQARNRVALALRDIKDNRSIEPLLTAIFKKENHNRNAWMVYALQSLDCSDKLIEIFTILFYETYQSKWNAFGILMEQKFSYGKEDLLKVEKMWEDCISHPEKCPDFESTKDDIQNIVDTYLSLIKPELLETLDPDYKVKFVGWL